MKSKLNDVPQERLHLEDDIARETGVPVGGSQGLQSKDVDTFNPSFQEAMDYVFEVFYWLTFMSEVEGLEGWEDDYINTQVDRYVSHEGHGMFVLATGDNSISDAPLASSFVMWFTKKVLAQLHLFRRPGWLWRRHGWESRGAPEFVERHVISTWARVLSGTAVGAERSVTRSFGPDCGGIPLRSFSFLRSLFSLQGNWE